MSVKGYCSEEPLREVVALVNATGSTDAAYENLLKSRRQALHRRTGEVLRDQFATTAAAEPELLAHHFTQAGLTEAAIEWWGKAAPAGRPAATHLHLLGLTRAPNCIRYSAARPLHREQP